MLAKGSAGYQLMLITLGWITMVCSELFLHFFVLFYFVFLLNPITSKGKECGCLILLVQDLFCPPVTYSIILLDHFYIYCPDIKRGVFFTRAFSKLKFSLSTWINLHDLFLLIFLCTLFNKRTTNSFLISMTYNIWLFWYMLYYNIMNIITGSFWNRKSIL
jgi:hypothetical protein